VIAVLLPVLNRPQRVQPVLDSLRLSGYPVRPFFICSFGDTAEIQAVEAARAEYLLVPWPAAEGDYARKINYGLGTRRSRGFSPGRTISTSTPSGRSRRWQSRRRRGSG